MKILFMIPRLTYSGAPKMMAWIANKMAEKGHEVHLVTFFSEEQARILNENITVHSMKVMQSKNRLIRNTIGMLRTIFRLHKIVRYLKPDIVLSFQNSVGYMYLPIGRLFTRSKLVFSERADPYAYHGKKAHVRFALMKCAHGNVFQTDGARNFFKNYKKIYENSVVIPNPVIVNEKILAMQKNIPAICEREKRIVTVGRLSLIQKRQDVLLEAFNIFHKKHSEYRLVIYGDGQDEKKIQSLVEQMGMSEYVTLAGRTDCVEDEIFNAAAFVLTSDFEGIPNALIEAMSIGVPSISTDCSPGGALLLIKDGENGFLVPRGDTKAIAEKLSILISDIKTAEFISKNGIFITRDFAENIIADKWENFFEGILKK